jgi:hypothetical protein
VASVSVKTGSGQTAAQSPQKLHSPAEKSTRGVASSLVTMICSEQASRQAPHPVQASAIEISLAQGGRIAAGLFVAVLK